MPSMTVYIKVMGNSAVAVGVLFIAATTAWILTGLFCGNVPLFITQSWGTSLGLFGFCANVWLILNSLQRGTIGISGGKTNRQEDPLGFWLAILISSLLPLFFLVFGVLWWISWGNRV